MRRPGLQNPLSIAMQIKTYFEPYSNSDRWYFVTLWLRGWQSFICVWCPWEARLCLAGALSFSRLQRGTGNGAPAPAPSLTTRTNLFSSTTNTRVGTWPTQWSPSSEEDLRYTGTFLISLLVQWMSSGWWSPSPFIVTRKQKLQRWKLKISCNAMSGNCDVQEIVINCKWSQEENRGRIAIVANFLAFVFSQLCSVETSCIF